MSYVFTLAEQNELKAARALCPADELSGGNFVPLYRKLSEIIGRHLSNPDGLDVPSSADLVSAKLWLDVAIGANGGTGMHSAFIRTFTNRQGELRYGSAFSDERMQMSSNVVAKNLWNNLTENDELEKRWAVPSIVEIADADASAIGVVLFGSLTGDTALTANAGWSGTIGFNMLGGSSPWQTWRLLTGGNEGSESKGKHGLAVFDTLDDLKNILFAVDSFDKGFKSGFIAGAMEFAEYICSAASNTLEGNAPSPESLVAQLNISIESGKIDPFIKNAVKGSPIAPYVNMIADIGVNETLDMLRRSVMGNGVSKTMSEGDFKSNALSFFSAISSWKDATIAQAASVSELTSNARQDFGSFLALNGLSMFRFSGDAALALLRTKQSDLYDQWKADNDSIGTGNENSANFTNSWIVDRGNMLNWLVYARKFGFDPGERIHSLGGIFPLPVAGDYIYRDVASGLVLDIDGVNFFTKDSHYISFGGNAVDNLSGGELSDSLYGGAGDDILRGREDDDHLEGGDGNDTLEGGEGSDKLLGGNGDDTYRFVSGDGHDVIMDKDGLGAVEVDGTGLSGGKLLNFDGKIWLSEDKKVKFALNDTGAGKDLHIAYGAGFSDGLVIVDYHSGDFGITLEDALPVAITPSVADANVVPKAEIWKSHDATRTINYIKYLGGDASYLVTAGSDLNKIYLGDGNNYVVGGSGVDHVAAGEGDNVIAGGGGRGTLQAHNGNNRIYVNYEASIESARTQAKQAAATGQKGVFLIVGNGDNTLVGGNDNDVFFLGSGNNTVIAGPGDTKVIAGAPWNGRSSAIDFFDEDPEVFGWESQFGSTGLTGDLRDPANYYEDSAGISLVGRGYNLTESNRGNFTGGLDGNTPINVPFGLGNDTIFGGAGDDVYWLSNGDNYVDAGAGDDHVLGGTGNSVLYGGAGNDTILGGGGNNLISGDSGDDLIVANGGTTVVLGGSGNVTIYAGNYGSEKWASSEPGSHVYIEGGSGNTLVYGSGANDTVLGGAGMDTLWGGQGSDELDGEDDDDVIVGGQGGDRLTGGKGDDTLHGDDDGLALSDHGADQLDGGDGADALKGYGGNDTLLGGRGRDTLVGDEGDDYLDGADDVDLLAGGVGNDTLIGGGGNDQLEAGEGNDVAVGDAGDDTLFGEAGNDALQGGDGADDLQGDAGADTLDGGAGVDTLRGGAENDLLTGGAESDYLFGDDGDDDLSGEAGNDQLQGGSGSDKLNGGQGDDLLQGEDGDDMLVGGSGADDLQGGDGNDALYGGDGADHLFGGNGDNLLDGGDGDDALVGGDGNDNLIGGAGLDQLWGFGGNDTLDGGGGGHQFLDGGAGNDVYIVRGGSSVTITDSAADANRLVLPDLTSADALTLTSANDGSDAVISFDDGNYINVFGGMAGSIKTVQLSDGAILSWAQFRGRTWRSMVNASTNTAGNELGGGALGDTLAATGGRSSLYGGRGDDTLNGAGGNNTYAFDLGDGTDVINDAGGTLSGKENTLAFGAGIRAADVSLALENNQLVIVIQGGAAPASGVAMAEAAAATTASAVSVDKIILGSTNVNNPLATPTIANFTFADGSSRTFAAMVGEGSTVTGTAGADTLNGTVMNDLIDGLAGNDSLNGASGNDTLIGGLGDDTLNGGYGADVYRFGRGDGADRIIESDGVGKLVFAAGIAPTDVSVGRDGVSNDLRLAVGSDSVTIQNWLASTSSQIGSVEFADGTVWTADQLTASYAYQLGTAGNDQLTGLSGRDTLNGALGNDSLYGGGGDDVYLYNKGDGYDLIVEQSGIDTVRFGPGISAADLRFARIEPYANGGWINLQVSHADGTPMLNIANWFGQSPYNSAPYGELERFEFADGSVLLGSAISIPFKTQTGGAGDDRLIGNDLFADTLYGGAGNDTLEGGLGNDALYGEAGNDSLSGSVGTDALTGGAGNDTLDGGDSSDNIYFGRGDGADKVIAYAFDFGYDTVWMGSDILPGDVQLSRNDGDMQLRIGATADQISLAEFFQPWVSTAPTRVAFANGTVWTTATMQTAMGMRFGTTAADTMTGSDTVGDILYGKEGNDSLSGLGGDDVLAGGSGNDTLVGGIGNDSYFADANDTVVEAVGAGTDTLLSADYSTTLPANVENLKILRVSGQSIGTGNALNNQLFGNDGDDTLDGLGGADTLTGGKGQDTYYVDVAGDVLVEDANGGTDSVFSAVSYSLNGTNLEHLTLTGSVALNATGNAAANRLVGNSLNNLLTAYAGDDYLNGGTGADTLIGGTGNDSYEVSDVGDTVTENAGEGVDSITLYNLWLDGASWALPANIENLTLDAHTAPGANTYYNIQPSARGATITGTAADNRFVGAGASDSFSGGDGNDYLSGAAGNDTLDGGAGVDTMYGGTGNDVFYVDNAADSIGEVSEAGSVDTVYASVNFTLADNLESLYLTGTAQINGTGNAAANVITGNSAANVLNGGAGNDTLDGALGADTLVGGSGNDSYTVDSGDTIVEYDGEGIDAVSSAVSFTLMANLENLTLTGTANINGTGNAVDNLMFGNNGANSLSGLAGNDTLVGWAGNDTMAGGQGDDWYEVDSSSDVVTELAEEGIDMVNTSASFILGAHVENLTLSGSLSINGTGNELANILYGNAGANVLDGAGGADTMTGGLGDDTYVIDNAGDVVYEFGGQGIDTIRTSATYTLADQLENLTLLGSSAIGGSGNAADNLLTGNGAANVLSGAAGNDTLDGGAGNDALTGGSGNDVYLVDAAGDTVTELAGEGMDEVVASLSYTLGNNVEVLSLSGSGATSGTGNADNNLIKGNGANNVLAGGAGYDILQGGLGDDRLTDTEAGNVFDGGAGIDTIVAGAGNDFIIGGAGADLVTTGSGADVLGFNRGDGMDTVNASTVKDNTVSLGKGIMYKDLFFKKDLNDLILVTGTSEQITIKDWYLGSANHNVANLQVVIEGTTDYLATSTNKINNRKIEVFDFEGLVSAFDAARAKSSKLTSWGLAASLPTYYVSGSDTAALGGDFAYQYAQTGSVSGIAMNPALALIGAPGFGTSLQTLQASGYLQDGSPRLM